MDRVPEEALDSEPANVGGTRPALVPFFGIPYDTLVPICVVGFMVAQWVHGLWGLFYGAAVAAFLWLPAFIMTKRDYNAVRIFRIWIRTWLTCPDRHVFHGVSVSPFPVRRSKRGRGVSDAV